MRRLTGDAGSVTTEVVIVAPIAIVLLCFVAFVGRTATAREQVDEAARDGARAASLERTPIDARVAAETTAATALADGGFTCASSSVLVDSASFAPGGQVTVTVACEIPLTDLGLLGIPGSRVVTATSVSVVDLYRGTA